MLEVDIIKTYVCAVKKLNFIIYLIYHNLTIFNFSLKIYFVRIA